MRESVEETGWRPTGPTRPDGDVTDGLSLAALSMSFTRGILKID